MALQNKEEAEQQFMTKYIASFAILSGAQLGSVFGQTGKKVLLVLSFPIDKRTKLRTTSYCYTSKTPTTAERKGL